MANKTLQVMCRLYEHVVPNQMLMKLREIAQGEVSLLIMIVSFDNT